MLGRVTSETGRLLDVLLCRPDHYAWQATNSIARATLEAGRAFDRKAAEACYGELEAALDEAGVRRHYLTPEPHLPYQIYTRDSSQTTPWGPVMTQLFRPQRRGEYASVLKFYQAQGGFWNYSTIGTLEGGDIHVIRPGLLLIGWSGERTDEAGARQFARWFEAEGWDVRIEHFPEHFLHLDVIFCMANERLAVGCVEVLGDDLVAWLRDRQIEVIPVSYRDTMEMGCNILALGGDRVISPRHSSRLNADLRANGLQVIDPDLKLFALGGGSIHCMTMPLARDPI